MGADAENHKAYLAVTARKHHVCLSETAQDPPIGIRNDPYAAQLALRQPPRGSSLNRNGRPRVGSGKLRRFYGSEAGASAA